MDAVMLAVIGAVLLLLGGAAVVFGVLPLDAALEIGDRVWPILLFVVAVTIVAELAARAGVFDAAAARLARLSRGRVILLWLMVVAFAAVVTAFLSLDTTAVLLTPVVPTSRPITAIEVSPPEIIPGAVPQPAKRPPGMFVYFFGMLGYSLNSGYRIGSSSSMVGNRPIFS